MGPLDQKIMSCSKIQGRLQSTLLTYASGPESTGLIPESEKTKNGFVLFLLTSYFIVNWASKLHDSSGWSSYKENFLLVSKLYFLIKIIVTNIIAWIRTNRIIVILLYLMFMFMIMKCLCWDGNVFYNKGIFFLFFLI